MSAQLTAFRSTSTVCCLLNAVRLHVLIQHNRHHQHEDVFAIILFRGQDHTCFIWCRHGEFYFIRIHVGKHLDQETWH